MGLSLALLVAVSGSKVVRAGRVVLAVLLIGILVRAAQAQTVPWSSVSLAGNHPLEAANRYPVAHADPRMQLNMQVTLGLRNQAELDQLLRDLQNPTSPRYHQWLTPAQFVARFGPAQADLDAVVQWLGAQGLKVTGSSLTQRYVRFTGSVADAEQTFGTNIMLFGDGSAYSNITDPAIPARFNGVISAVGGLDNLLHSMAYFHATTGPQPAAADASGSFADSVALLDSGPALPQSGHNAIRPVPDVTVGGFTSFGPPDFYSFYDENTLLSGGTNGGGGDCIGVVEDSDYLASAVSLFNTTFGLSASKITTVLADSPNPGINGDELETLLDLEWSHAVAPGAATRLYLGNDSSNTNGPIVDGIQSAVNENLCGAISVSFGLCGASSSFYTGVVSPIYAQAATQGQSIFISSSDNGAAGVILNPAMTACIPGTSANINELGADPNVTQVGGTFFTPNYNPVTGDNIGNVTESAWNSFYQLNPPPAAPTQLATGGGVSAVYSKPAYQAGPGVPADGKRDVPDVALMAALAGPTGDGVGVFLGYDNSGTPAIECCFLGTSLAAPSWAGISKLIAQLEKGRPGPLNPRIYALANAGEAASGFRDVTTGNNDYGSVVGYSAGPGFDLTTGWGTADIGTFANDYVTPPSPSISSIPSTIDVGSSFTINGNFFSPGAMVNFFIATAGGPINAGPLTPSSNSATQLTVPVPTNVQLGQGFVTVQVVNTDLGFQASNGASALLQGSAAAGIPTLSSINGDGLAPTSSNPSYATNNVETVIIQGNDVTLGGSGFDAANGVAVNVFCACKGGNAGPVFVNPGSGGLTSSSFSFTLPAGMPTGPASLAVVNKGADGSYKYSSNAVSVAVGAAISVTSVTESAGVITVNGTGFSTLTVINFFNLQGSTPVNLGGLNGATPKIPLTLLGSTKFTFTKPAGAVAGPSYVQALNPPFVPFTSSGNSPGGAFTLF